MNRHSVLIKNTFLYSAGPLLNKIVAVILIPCYSYLLTTSELGYYNLVVTTTSLVITIATLKISDAVYRWFIDSAGDAKKQIAAISNSLVIIIGDVFLVAVFLHYFPPGLTFNIKVL